MKRNTLLGLLICFLCACGEGSQTDSPFVTIENGHFVKQGKPYYYVGTNFWYGAILASEGEGGNRARLHQELDSLVAIGVDNLRILVGADGANGITAKVEPALQIEPGVYNDTILAGLDYLLVEMEKRNMSAILYLNNSWEWSGGYSQYLEWSGFGKAPVPAEDGWDAFNNYVNLYHKHDEGKQLFANHVEFILSRTNRYTQKRYADDATIMSWQIGNEPRPFGEENKESFGKWIHAVADQIRSLAPNHLISTGNEGSHGSQNDINLWEFIHSSPNIDYTTIHIWPWNWGWAPTDQLAEKLDYSIEQSNAYIGRHLAIAEKLNKPMVIEEFGFPRDQFQFSPSSTTAGRDRYYESIFGAVVENSRKLGKLAGCNFWAWGGSAQPNPDHVFWKKGDDYMGDPAQEEQGLYSVFQTDSTVELVKRYNEEIARN